MSAVELLLREFERLSETPGAVPKLRRFVLDLAVRGRLVGSTRDRPAARDWVRTTVGEVLELRYGKSLPAHARLELGPVAVFGSNGVVAYADESLTTAPAIIVGRKGSAGALNISVGPSWTTDVAYFVVPPACLDLRFLYLTFRSLELERLAKGVKPGLSRTDVYELEISIPPLEEQRQMVASLDDLMALCDRLEAAQAERERRREAVSLTSLREMTNSGKADVVATLMRIHSRNLDVLLTRPKHVSPLREALLHAAASGAFRGGVDLARTHLRHKAAARSATGWPALRLDEVAEQIVDCPHSTPKWTASGKICVRTNQFHPGRLDLDSVRYVSEATYYERVQRLTPRADDILYSREGGILGVACRVPPNTELCLGQRMMLIRASEMIDPGFLEIILNSPQINQLAKAATTGGAAPRVNVATVRAYPIPLPPLSTQRAVVAMVNEIMGVSGQVELRLTQEMDERSRVLDAVLREAVHAS